MSEPSPTAGRIVTHWRRVGLTIAVALTAAVGLASPTGATSDSGSATWCPNAVNLAKARASVGRRVPVRLKARVASVKYAKTSRGRPTFIDLGYPYPDKRRLTLLVWGSDRVNFPRPPERMFRSGQLVCAQGFVSSHRGVPQVEVGLWDAVGRLLSF